jgi:hypothetical protein
MRSERCSQKQLTANPKRTSCKATPRLESPTTSSLSSARLECRLKQKARRVRVDSLQNDTEGGAQPSLVASRMHKVLMPDRCGGLRDWGATTRVGRYQNQINILPPRHAAKKVLTPAGSGIAKLGATPQVRLHQNHNNIRPPIHAAKPSWFASGQFHFSPQKRFPFLGSVARVHSESH